MALFPDVYDLVNLGIPSSVIAPEAIFFGAENLTAEADPPRIVWDPTTDSFMPPQARGSDRAELRVFYTCESGVDIHCWGEDTPGALVLRDAVVQALRTKLGPNIELAGGRWLKPELVHSGRVYVLSFRINIPVTEAAPTGERVVTVTAETHTGTFVSP